MEPLSASAGTSLFEYLHHLIMKLENSELPHNSLSPSSDMADVDFNYAGNQNKDAHTHASKFPENHVLELLASLA